MGIETFCFILHFHGSGKAFWEAWKHSPSMLYEMVFRDRKPGKERKLPGGRGDGCFPLGSTTCRRIPIAPR